MQKQHSDKQALRLLLESLITQLELKDSDRILAGNQLNALRAAWGLTLEEFGSMVGLDPRTVRRYELGESAMNVVVVRLWRQLFVDEQAAEPARDYADRIDALSHLPGVLGSSEIFDRMRQADEVWALRCRTEFRAAESEYISGEFADLFKKNPSFSYNCIWIDHEALGENEPNSKEVRPANLPRASYIHIRDTITAIAAEAAGRIRGFEVSPDVAARVGLANSPVSMLTVAYGSAATEKFQRKYDLFLEIPIALYHRGTKTRIRSEDPMYWVHVHPPYGECYYHDIWGRFTKILETYAQVSPPAGTKGSVTEIAAHVSS